MAIIFQSYCFHARRSTSHRAHGVLREADNLTIVAGYEHLALAIGQGHTDQFVAITQSDGIDTIGARTAVGLQRRLLHQAVLGGEDEVVVLYVLGVVQTFYINKRAHAIALLQVDDVLDSAALRLTVAFRQVIHLNPIQAAPLGKEHHRGVHRSLMDVLDEVFITAARGFCADTAAGLLTELCERGALDIT